MGKIRCTYNITSVGQHKIIDFSEYEGFYYNGKYYEDIISDFYFNTVGLAEIQFVFPKNSLAYYGYLFYDVPDLITVVIEDGVTSIGTNAFRSCVDLESVVIPSSVTYIADGAFGGCSKLESIISYAKTSPSVWYGVFSGVKEGGTLYYLKGSDYSLWKPELDGLGWTYEEMIDKKLRVVYKVDDASVAVKLYNNNHFETIKYNGETITTQNYLFPSTGSHTVEFVLTDNYANGVGNRAFYGCTAITSVVLSPTAEVISSYAFYGCNKLQHIDFGKNLREIGYQAFRDCDAFRGSADGWTTRTLNIPDTVTSIGGYAFDNCLNIVSANIGKGLKEIPEGLFYWCVSLRNVSIGKNVTKIYKSAFKSTSLSEIRSYAAVAPTLNSESFEGAELNGMLYYPMGSDYSEWLSTTNYYLGSYQWDSADFEVPPEPSITVEYRSKTYDGNAVSSTIDVNYADMTLYTPSKYMTDDGQVPEWFDISTTSFDEENGINVYTYNLDENLDKNRKLTVLFEGEGYDGEGYYTTLDIKQNKKEEIIMATSIVLYKLKIDYTAEGGSGYVQVDYINPSQINEPVALSEWVTIVQTQQGNTTSGADKVTQRQYRITVPSTTLARNTNIKFSCTDANGNLVEENKLVINQAAPSVVPIIAAFSNDYKVDENGNVTSMYDTVKVGYKAITTINQPVASSDWITVGDAVKVGGIFYDYDNVYEYSLSFAENDLTVSRTGTITFSGFDAQGNLKEVAVSVTQSGIGGEPDVPDEPDVPTDSEETTYSPIWKDIYYRFTTDTFYSIYEETDRYVNQDVGYVKEEKLIYSGKVYLPPSYPFVNVMINKVCQNYFTDNVLVEEEYVGQSHNFKKFVLRGEYGQKLHTYYFVNDWSYEQLTVGIKTNPIVPVFVDGQRLFFSAFSDSTQRGFRWGLMYNDGTEDYSNTEYVKDDLYSMFVLPSRLKGVSKFFFGEKHYSMIPKCKAQYVLYYINPKGGWDWFPILGKVNKSDSITQYTYSNNYDNTTHQFGKYRYLSEISTTYNLNTGFLTEEQSDRMWELLESNCVYLHNVVEDKIYPVIITDNEIEYKRKMRGRKMLTYSINVESSQTRERI